MPHSEDLGIRLVYSFNKVFTCFIGDKPSVPNFSNSIDMLIDYRDKSSAIASDLKRMASKAKDDGDEAGSLLLIRLQLIQEELSELAEAIVERDIVECFDALVDLSYVVDGAYITLGLHEFKEAGLQEVHRSNMSKLDSEGKPILSDAGRVVKGPNYSPPNLECVLRSKDVERNG